jgi:hypothetical protein
MCPARFPHARSNSAGVPRQAGARKNLHKVESSPRPCRWTLEDEKRPQGDVVTSGVQFVAEGGKNTARTKKDGYP